MLKSLLQWLICPVCGHGFKLDVLCSKGDEITEGKLNCPCDQKFPIIAGVPRLLCDGLREDLPQLYPEFFNRYSELFNSKWKLAKTDLNQQKKMTMDRFGFEWLHFSDYNCDNFKQFIAPLPVDFFKGKLGLDIGCGAGRHAEQASQNGAEIIGIDLSQAVDAAQQNNIENKLVHIIQADIYNLPIKPGIFDFVYSLGVLHHLPEPEKGYRTLIQLLREGGALFVWLYAFSARKIALEILRAITRQMSNNNIRRVAYLCNLLDYGICINLYRLLTALPYVSLTAKKYAPLRIKEYANHGFKINYTDWFDRLSAPITNYYKENKMLEWLKHSGLIHTRLLLEGDSWWWLYGERNV